MKKEPNDKITYWLDLCDYDMATAEVMLEGKRFLYVGFMCHQVIEKALKAHYVDSRGGTPPHSHNLSYLAKQSGIYNDLSETQKDFLDLLEPLNVEARYPTHKEKILKTLGNEKCREILSKTKELFQWIKKRLSK